MELFEDYVIKKEVNKSLLTEGFSIPIEYQVVFKRNLGKLLKRGETKEITLYLNGKPYKVQIKNQKFDDDCYCNHTDIVQVRYNKNSEIANEFRRIFYKSNQYISKEREQAKLPNQNNKKFYINIPDESKEYLIIYA